jgi:hypothetical protein
MRQKNYHPRVALTNRLAVPFFKYFILGDKSAKFFIISYLQEQWRGVRHPPLYSLNVRHYASFRKLQIPIST